jgi:hypothetical protein
VQKIASSEVHARADKSFSCPNAKEARQKIDIIIQITAAPKSRYR